MAKRGTAKRALKKIIVTYSKAIISMRSLTAKRGNL